MTAKEYARTSARVTRLAALGVVTGSLAWLQGVAWGAGLGIATIVAVNVVPAWMAPLPAATPALPKTPLHAPRDTTSPDSAEDPPRIEVKPPAPEEPVGRQAPALPLPLPEARVVPSAVTSASPPAGESDSLFEETALLQSAYQSLASNPAESLALAETHATRFPKGMLGMEREIVIVDALHRLGRTAEARARGEAILARAPGSVYEERIRMIIGLPR